METATCPNQRSTARQRFKVAVSGKVQGVGFRPFVYRLATSEGLAGSVRNTAAGASLEVEGCPDAIARFLARLEREARPPAQIERLDREELAVTGEDGFAIAPSTHGETPSAAVLPDLAMCSECRAELLDPNDRRYRYPFTTCMHCGPRYSIIEAIPYDRARTVMRQFPMCAACQAEYDDPGSRRFHAETNACPDCGPQLALCLADGTVLARMDEALSQAVAAIRDGRIVALKGLGGFQLIVDAANDEAIARLRQRKQRPAKPFAITVRALPDAETLAHVSAVEAALLLSRAAPIVLLRQRGGGPISPGVAPDNPDIGIMLPSTPLHHLLMAALRFPVVATSGNRSGEPIAASDEEAFARLGDIADVFLTHDRPILRPVDDSVVRVIDGEATVLRCARGFAPLALTDECQAAPVLALGGHMKSSVAVARDGRIVLGPHVGDLDSAETRPAHARSVEGMEQLYSLDAAVVACDAHPDYHTTRLAEAISPAPRRAPHHLAHVLSAMIDNGLEGPVIGIAWDGTGHGGDGTIWGGEFLSVDRATWRREAHLLPFRLPGGDAAIREPRRSAIGALHTALGKRLWQRADIVPLAAFEPAQRELLRSMLARGLNSPLTSSAGRLFDAAAAILGLRQTCSFEGEAAMAVEFAARNATRRYPLPTPGILSSEQGLLVDWRPMLEDLAFKAGEGESGEILASAFIDWLAEAIAEVARYAGIERVVLTGGCFQNALLTGRTMERLRAAGFQPFRHRRVPPNDGGLAVGQAAIAAREMHEESGRCALPYPANC
ncbi:MAG: carbamoyltransferase HypF [Novosphingobium sp.]|nr:carbamoyltransferase HypF [Novosphingobium sp.]MCB2077521.1 carbamoyltransferase HypF [Novosphingobium sp.]